MTIQVGDQLPAGTLSIMGEKGPQPITIQELTEGKKTVIFAVPGAFTPGCSIAHLPGFVVNADKIKAKGVDNIVCLAVNDAFVMCAWGKNQNAEEIIMAGDGSATYTKALGLDMDLTSFGMGVRSKRYAMLVDNGVVKYLGIDAKDIKDSSAEAILALL